MIQAVMVFNNSGKPRLMDFYTHITVEEQQQFLLETYNLLTQRTDKDSCNFVDRVSLFNSGNGSKIMYKHLGTLYFVFCCDSSESELAILDLIQVFVEALDKCFENLCELDLIFHADKAHFLLNEIVMGGVVLETSVNEVIARYREQLRLEERENKVIPVISKPTLPSLPTFPKPSLPSLPTFQNFKWRNMSINDVEFMRM